MITSQVRPEIGAELGFKHHFDRKSKSREYQ